MDKGEVWLYKDMDSEGKPRPCVIIGNNPVVSDGDVLIAKLTTHPPRSKFDVIVEQWQEAGLRDISCVRCSKLIHIKAELLMVKVAKLTPYDLIRSKTIIAEYILD